MTRGSKLGFLKKKTVQRAWIALVLLWASFRALVISDLFGKYGVNGWAYFAVDLGSSIPYAIYSGRAVTNFLNKDRFKIRKNLFLSLIFFYTPDIFVLAIAKTPPFSLVVGFLISIVFFTLFAIWSFRRDTSITQNSARGLD